MDADTRAALLAAIRAEVEADPTARGYAGKSAGEIAALLSAPIVVAAPVEYRDVPVSSVEGYMRLRTHIVKLTRWVAAQPVSDLRDFAEELLGMIAAANVGVFQTSDPDKRAGILGAFAALAAVGAGGFTAQSVVDLTAMTVAPAVAPTVGNPRWLDVMLSLPYADRAGMPNEIAADDVAEALS